MDTTYTKLLGSSKTKLVGSWLSKQWFTCFLQAGMLFLLGSYFNSINMYALLGAVALIAFYVTFQMYKSNLLDKSILESIQWIKYTDNTPKAMQLVHFLSVIRQNEYKNKALVHEFIVYNMPILQKAHTQIDGKYDKILTSTIDNAYHISKKLTE